MINFTLNNENIIFSGNPDKTLIEFLRGEKHLTATKDGCSGQGVCGACTVEINGKARMACTTKMKSLENATVFTLEGIPENIKNKRETTLKATTCFPKSSKRSLL